MTWTLNPANNSLFSEKLFNGVRVILTCSGLNFKLCVSACESKTRGGSISHFCSFNFIVANNRINLSEIGNLRLLNRNTLECCPFLNLFSALKTEVRFLTSKREELTIRLIAIQWNFWFLCESTRLLDAMIQTTIHLYCWYLIHHSYHH